MEPSKSLLREYLEALLIAVIFATFARTYVIQAFKIPTGSMEQNLLIGDHILVNKFVFGPVSSRLERLLLPYQQIRRGDVVVFKFPENPSRDFIKRCVGLPGDEVEIVNKELFVNGMKVDDSTYTYRTDSRIYPRSVFLYEGFRDRDNVGPVTIPADQFFFLGDNRDNSNDSRFWGTVPAHYIKGRAFMIYWSFDSPGDTEHWPGYLGKIRQLAQVLATFFSGTRWERTLQIVR
ncbi:MAG: signal peptidase I [Acidobacteriota bacterium]